MISNEIIYDEVKALHKKIDKHLETTVRNTTDIAWLKKGVGGVLGSIFTYAGAVIWFKLNKQ